MPDLTLLQAINLALHRAMKDDPGGPGARRRCRINGGVFRATEVCFVCMGKAASGYAAAEAGITGVAIGLRRKDLAGAGDSVHRLRRPRIDQLLNHASRLRRRTRGRLTCPMVLRLAGGGIHAVEHHSKAPKRCSPISPD
jgi:pyruvate dehydrogenase E1 component beta subunit